MVSTLNSFFYHFLISTPPPLHPLEGKDFNRIHPPGLGMDILRHRNYLHTYQWPLNLYVFDTILGHFPTFPNEFTDLFFTVNSLVFNKIKLFINNILFFDLGFIRSVCYRNEQKNCNEEFVDVYKNLSKSANGRKVANTYFWLFTRKNPEEPEVLQKCGGKLPPNTNFNPKNELIVILNPYLAGICDFAIYRVKRFNSYIL